MFLSIIIPTYQEAGGLASLLSYIKAQALGQQVEILVVDANSPDGTAKIASKAGATVISCAKSSRAIQMNIGAKQAKGQVLYFLHADSYPPPGFVQAIQEAVAAGQGAGCFQMKFDHPHWFLTFMAFWTRLKTPFARFGDQSLFVYSNLFEDIQGFKENLMVMEDQEIAWRLQKQTKFAVLPQKVITSARKYRENGIIKVQLVFSLIQIMYYLGVSQKTLIKIYKRLIKM